MLEMNFLRTPEPAEGLLHTGVDRGDGEFRILPSGPDIIMAREIAKLGAFFFQLVNFETGMGLPVILEFDVGAQNLERRIAVMVRT